MRLCPLLLACCLTAFGASAQDTIHVAVSTSDFQSLPGASVLLAVDGIAHQAQTDSNGSTPPIPLVASTWIEVELGETPTLSPDGVYTGTTLGQRFGQDVAPLLTAGEDVASIRYFQPLLRDVSVPYDALINDPFSGWAIESDTPFSAQVGELVNTEVVSNYLAYYAGAHDTAYHQAVVVAVDAEVELGEDGFVLWVDRTGYPVAAPSVSAQHVGSSGEGESDLAAAILAPLNDQGYLAVQVSGTLQPGHNVVFLGESGSAGRRNRSTPISGPYIQLAPPGTDCEEGGNPIEDMMGMPGAGWVDGEGNILESSQCGPDPGAPYSNCVDTGCQLEYLTLGDASAACGTTVNHTFSQGWSGGATVGFDVDVLGSSLSMGLDGSVSGQHSFGVTVSGGYHAYAFIGYVRCTAHCDKTITQVSVGGPVTKKVHETVSCMDGVVSGAAACQFDDCE